MSEAKSADILNPLKQRRQYLIGNVPLERRLAWFGLADPLNGSCVLIMCLDATFDILASPDPLLSVSLSPSQNLYTRRGTLVGVSGKAENVSL